MAAIKRRSALWYLLRAPVYLYRWGAVKHLLTSVVREICTLRSVGAEERATALGHLVGTGQLVSLP